MPKGTERECLRCGHKWTQRRSVRPRRCALCGNPYWDTPRRAPEDEPLEAGRDSQEPELPDNEEEKDSAQEARYPVYVRPR